MKNTYKHIILFAILTIECAFGVYMGARVMRAYTDYRIRQKTPRVTYLPKTRYIATTSSSLQYYYEPGPNSSDEDLWPLLTERVINTSNSQGINSDHEFVTPKPPSIFRIAALGDSFTYGLHVNTPDAWPNYLERYLNEQCRSAHMSFEVVNMGVPGYDMVYEYERYRLRGVQFDPDLILWMFIINDFTDINEFMTPIARKVHKQMAAENTLDPVNEWTAPTTKARDQMMKEFTREALFQTVDAYFTSFSALYSGPVVFMTFPSVDDDVKGTIRSWTERRNFTWYNDAVDDVESLRHTLPDGHPNAVGHQKIAENIYAYLFERNLIPCRK